MAPRIKPVRIDRSKSILKWTSFALACLGAADAVYLLVLKLTQLEKLCIGNHGCITVNNSVYSEIYGIPVSAFGIVAYVIIAGILLLEDSLKPAKDNGPLAVFGISLAGTLFSGYLTWVEFSIIHAMCPFCLASAAIITLLFLLAIIRLVKQLSI